MDAPPIYAESPPARPSARFAVVASLVVLFPAALAYVVARPLGLWWGNVARVALLPEFAVLALVVGATAAASVFARRRLAIWRRAASRALLALIAGALAWVLLSLGGKSPIASGEGGVVLVVAALLPYAVGEALGIATAAAPWPRGARSARLAARALGVAAGLALAIALVRGPALAPLVVVGVVWIFVLAATRVALSVHRAPADERIEPCPRCGASGRFAAGTTPCDVCGLLVRNDGYGSVHAGGPVSRAT